MLVVLKIPLVYLAVVVWWAIRAEPTAEDGWDGDGGLLPLTPCGWEDWKRERRGAARGRRPFRPTGHPARARRTHAVT